MMNPPLCCISWSSPEDWLGMTDRYEKSQLWLQEPRLLLTDRDDRISSAHPSNSIIMQHSCLGHTAAARGHTGYHRMLVTTCPRGLVTGCRSVGARLVRVLLRTGPAPQHPQAARPGPRTLHPLQTSWVSPSEQRTPRIQVSTDTGPGAFLEKILLYFLHCCILLICQYLLSADKHRS